MSGMLGAALAGTSVDLGGSATALLAGAACLGVGAGIIARGAGVLSRPAPGEDDVPRDTAPLAGGFS